MNPNLHCNRHRKLGKVCKSAQKYEKVWSFVTLVPGVNYWMISIEKLNAQKQSQGNLETFFNIFNFIVWFSTFERWWPKNQNTTKFVDPGSLKTIHVLWPKGNFRDTSIEKHLFSSNSSLIIVCKYRSETLFTIIICTPPHSSNKKKKKKNWETFFINLRYLRQGSISPDRLRKAQMWVWMMFDVL